MIRSYTFINGTAQKTVHRPLWWRISPQAQSAPVSICYDTQMCHISVHIYIYRGVHTICNMRSLLYANGISTVPATTTTAAAAALRRYADSLAAKE